MTEEADRRWVLHSGGYWRRPDGGEGGRGEARHQEDVLRPTLPQHSQLNECVLRSGFDSECFQSRSRDRRPTLVLPSGRDGGLLPGVDAAHGGGGQGEGGQGRAPGDSYKISATYMDGYKATAVDNFGGGKATKKARVMSDSILLSSSWLSCQMVQLNVSEQCSECRRSYLPRTCQEKKVHITDLNKVTVQFSLINFYEWFN